MYIFKKSKVGQEPEFCILDFESEELAKSFQYNDNGNSITLVTSISWEQKRKIIRAISRLNKKMPNGYLWVIVDVKKLKKNVKVGFTLNFSIIGKYKVYITI